MLQNIHDNAKGWVAYLIVGLISVPFALWGIQEYLGDGSSRVVATVNGEEIPLLTVQNAVSQQRQRLAQLFGGRLPPGFDDASMQKSALDTLISQELLDQKSADQGYRASPNEVLDSLMTVPDFQKDGKFDRNTYATLIRTSGRTVSQFEDELRSEVTREHFTKALRDTGFVPQKEAKAYHALQEQTRAIDFYTIKLDGLKEGITLDDAKVKEYFDKNSATFMTNEKVQLAYVELDKAKLSASIEVNDEVLQTYFDENADAYFTPETYELSHILLKVSKDRDDAKTKALADTLYASINDGSKTFADVAKEQSDDKANAEKGGSLGLIAKGDMEDEFEKVAFALKEGEISEPVKTSLGYQIIRSDKVVASVQKPFAESKSTIERDYRNQQADKRFYDDSEMLQRIAFEQSGSLEPAAQSVNLEVKNSALFARGKTDDDFTSSAVIQKAAFSDRVLEGQNSDLLEISPDRVAIVRLLKQEKPQPKAFDDVKEDIITRLTNDAAREKAVDQGKAILEKLKADTAWDALADLGVKADEVVKDDGVKRAGSEQPAYVVSHVFKMATPEAGKAIYDTVVAPNGDYTVLALRAVKEGEGDVSNSAKQRYASYFGNREVTAAMKALREAADVTIDDKSLVNDQP